MRRLEPTAALALPPISNIQVTTDANGWTVTERRLPAGVKASKAAAVVVPQRNRDSRDTKAEAGNGGPGSLSARGVPGEQALPPSMEQTVPRSPVAASSPRQDDASRPKQTAMKGRAIEDWLNHTLGQARPDAAAVGTTTAKQLQGLSQFGVDAAALERLGLDADSVSRVYRAMFVYSQGLHAALQEAVSRSRSSSQALLVLWRAFTAVLEHAGQNEQNGAESLAALVQRGNEEEKAQIESQFRDQISQLQSQTHKLGFDRRSLQEEVQRLREDEMRLRNESEMYKNEHQVAMSKYEREIKQRVDAEVRFLEKTRWAEALQEDLAKEQKQSMHLMSQLQEANIARESAQVELDSLRTQVKAQESQVSTYKQSALEAAQQKQRHEQQVSQYKQNMERQAAKIAELKEQLEQEVEHTKSVTDQSTYLQRDMRKLETQYEDELHVRQELQSERDLLRDKMDRMDREMTELMEERRSMQKEINDLSMNHRTNQIELKRKCEQLERSDKQLDKVQGTYRDLMETHRALTVEAENLQEDVQHLDEQVKKESELRKALQHEKKQVLGQIQSVTIERDSAQLVVTTTQKELQEVTEKTVKLESIVRDTKSAMQKVNLEHQVEAKAHSQKVAMLEKVIADERNQRRVLVAETEEVVEKREEALEQLRKKEIELRDLKRQRLEKEEEVDRYKILLKAQEQRNDELLVTVDKYHASVANHDAETRQMQVLLECERVEAKRQFEQLQAAHAAARYTLEQRIEYAKLCYEDVLSRLNFNPTTEKLLVLEVEVTDLRKELEEAKLFIDNEREKMQNMNQELEMRQGQIKELEHQLESVEGERDTWINRHATVLLDAERQAVARNDAEHQCERIRQNTEEFDQMKSALETQLAQAKAENARLYAILHKPQADAETQVYVYQQESQAQTDLSYQYLESSEPMQQQRWRRERLDELRKASRFVEDPAERRDFTIQMRTLAAPADVELSLAPSEARSTGSGFNTVGPPAAAPPGPGAKPAAGAGGRPVPGPSQWKPKAPDKPPGAPPKGSHVQRPGGRGGAPRPPSEGGLQVAQVVTGPRAAEQERRTSLSASSPSPWS